MQVEHASDHDSPFGNLPEELTALSQWVVWKFEGHGKPKLDKVPYDPRTRQNAKSNDPSTWATFAEAIAAYQRGGFDGIGFVFSEADLYAGIDLDKCRDPDTGRLEPRASEIIRRLDSYTEVSPSGTGVHIIVRGSLPAGGRKHGAVEMYDRGRFFTMTGEHIGGAPTVIEDRTVELAALHAEVFGKSEKEALENGAADEHATPLSDEEIVILAKQAKNGEKFTGLWTGDTTGHPSPSEADLALCNILAFYCGPDPARIDRLFRQSGLYRKKWDEKHSSDGRTYGEVTIVKAVAGAREFYSARQSNCRCPDQNWSNMDDEAENARIIAAEREPDADPPPAPTPYPCPEVLWQGLFAEVAKQVGIRCWEVWSGTYAALSAVAHRNLHWRYFGDLFGMAYVLLISPTGAGKNLVADTCADLLLDSYTVRYGVQSGPGLIPLLTDASLNNKTGRLVAPGRPVMLIAEEWSRLSQVGGIEHSTLLEDLNALFQRRRPWSISRSHKTRTGGDIVITTPMLSICGTTTNTLFVTSISSRQMTGGSLNRYLTLPGRGVWVEYTGESPHTDMLRGLLDPLVAHAWGQGQEVKLAYSPPAWERFRDLQRHFFKPIMDNPETSEVMKRLHFYFHHVALIYAWSEKAQVIDMRHLHAAVQVISTSHQFLLSLLEFQHAHVEPPQFQRYEMGLERKILEKVKREPGIPKRKLTQDLHRQACCQDLGKCVDRLLAAGLLAPGKNSRRGQVLLFVTKGEG
jgi:hypothetical protein